MRNAIHRSTLVLAALTASACFQQDGMTQLEAAEAMGEALASGKGEALTNEVVEVSTDFTMGAALEAAAEELAAWWQSQAPCTIVTVDGSTVELDFGDLEDDCSYNGHTYAGITRITVESTDEQQLLVSHEWQDMTNGDVSATGEGDVTWAAGDNPSRHVEHAIDWSDAERQVSASGDRTQQLIDPDLGLTGGIVVDGTRDWSTEAGDWLLDIESVEMRGQDPVPQDGSYVLTTPEGDELVMVFERLDEDSIQVTVSGIRGGDRVWVVNSTGQIEEEPEE